MSDRLTEIAKWIASVREVFPSAHPLVKELVDIATADRAALVALRAEVESRPTYEDGVRAALACVDAVRASHCLTITDAANCIYALLEPTEAHQT